MTKNNGVPCDESATVIRLGWENVRTSQLSDTIANTLEKLYERNGPLQTCSIDFKMSEFSQNGGQEQGEFVYEMSVSAKTGNTSKKS